MSEHTSLPWESGGCEVWGQWNNSVGQKFVADLSGAMLTGSTADEVEANVDFIITACNEHAKLKEEVERLRAAFDLMTEICVRPMNSPIDDPDREFEERFESLARVIRINRTPPDEKKGAK